MKQMAQNLQENWSQFLDLMSQQCSPVEFRNWFEPIRITNCQEGRLQLQIPNIFVREYLLDNYKKELGLFLPLGEDGSLALDFVVESKPQHSQELIIPTLEVAAKPEIKLNRQYTFASFIEGPSNQFVKSAAIGVATHPGKSYNPLFIHGGVGLGKTHLLHAIGHSIQNSHKKLKIECITTEGFINELVDHLKNKSIDQMKRHYRSLDVLLVDDIQFLQLRPNFEEEFCNTFEALINQSKQIVITSDKPPSQLKLSQRLIARMEWGLVAGVGMPDLETRVAILQHKAESRGLVLPSKIAFFMAEHIFHNVRQLEGAINRLSAYCGLMHLDVTQDVVEKILCEMLQFVPHKRVTVESILKSVSSMFDVKISDLKGDSRTKEIAFPRQVAMYLAKELINDSLSKLADGFGGKTHSTLLHSWNKIRSQLESDENLRRKIDMTRRNLEA